MQLRSSQMGQLRVKSCHGAATLGIICPLISLAPLVSADDWPTAQHDLQRTGLTSSTLDPKTLKLSWSGPAMFTGPIIVGNSVIAIKNENLATAPTVIDSFNIANGAV